MKKVVLIIMVVSVMLLTGCSTKQFIAYQPERSFNVNAPFDKTWTAVIEYAASHNYTITNVEKESGIITMQTSLFKAAVQKKGVVDRNYYYTVERSKKLKGKDNLFVESNFNIHVKKLSESTCNVTVNLRDNGKVVSIDKKEKRKTFKANNLSTGTFEKNTIHEIMDNLRIQDVGKAARPYRKTTNTASTSRASTSTTVRRSMTTPRTVIRRTYPSTRYSRR